MAYRDKEQVGACIVVLREEWGLSRADLARELDLKASVLRRVEQGQRAIAAGEVIELADFFGISADAILCEEDDDFVLDTDVDSVEVHAALEKFDGDIETLMALEATVG